MRRLSRTFDQAAFAQKIALDSVRCDEDVARLGVKMILGGAEETETLLGNLQVTGTMIVGACVVFFAFGGCAHILCVFRRLQKPNPRKTVLNFEFLGSRCVANPFYE